MYPAFVLTAPGLQQPMAIYRWPASDGSSQVEDAGPWRMQYLYQKRNEASMRRISLA